MSKNIEKVVKNIEKIDHYFIIAKESDHLTVAVRITLKAEKESQLIFQPRTAVVNKDLVVIFLITLESSTSAITKEYSKRKIPILYLKKEHLSLIKEDLEGLLDDFVYEKFNC
jgi:hypothetical protein